MADGREGRMRVFSENNFFMAILFDFVLASSISPSWRNEKGGLKQKSNCNRAIL
jgi:hypothetical protein